MGKKCVSYPNRLWNLSVYRNQLDCEGYLPVSKIQCNRKMYQFYSGCFDLLFIVLEIFVFQ